MFFFFIRNSNWVYSYFTLLSCKSVDFYDFDLLTGLSESASLSRIATSWFASYSSYTKNISVFKLEVIELLLLYVFAVCSI